MASAVEKVKKEWARELYFGSEMSQHKIAERVGVAQKTISTWIRKGNWERAKALTEHTPDYVVFRMQNELAELNRKIAAREPGARHATLPEAEIRRKTMASIALYKKGVDFGATIQVMKNFIEHVTPMQLEAAQYITRFADDYIRMEKGILDAIPQHPLADLDLMPFNSNQQNEPAPEDTPATDTNTDTTHPENNAII